MAADQLPLDFSTVDSIKEEPSTASSNVVDFGTARRVKQQAELSSLYEGIYDSVKHVRLGRSFLPKLDKSGAPES